VKEEEEEADVDRHPGFLLNHERLGLEEHHRSSPLK
jgi:hypothetical protein